MGYTTTFKGELKFTKELTGKQLAKVKSFFGEDCREHPEWGIADGGYIDLEFNDDLTGIQWDSATEKNRGMLDHINLIIREMKKDIPGFGLDGIMMAQGEDAEDRWSISIVKGLAVRTDIVIKGQKVKCPDCGHSFFLETAE
jgi:hypothetical protein